MLKNGADINVFDAHGNAPLHLAIKANNTKTAEALIKKEPDLSIRNSEGYTPFHLAVKQGNVGLIDLLINQSDLTTKDNHDNTLLHSFVEGFIESLHIHGSDIKEQWKEWFKRLKQNNLNSTNKAGLTPLHIAATFKSTEMIDYFCTNGANLDAVDAAGNTPLFLFIENAIKTNRAIFVDPIKKLATSNNVNLAPYDLQETPLSMIIKRNHPYDADVIKYLLKIGAYPPVIANGNETPPVN
ncbi:MAG: ankyrin repeat domain-containing protein [Chlamydiia bacterium]|nr:ankyrin repeat domain-containing protein [Chlamydiia bacterium]